MANRPEREGYEGLSKIAHAIRRIGALYVAALILPPETSIDDLKAQAEDLAKWAGGRAQEQEQQQEQAGRPAPLGEQWPPRD